MLIGTTSIKSILIKDTEMCLLDILSKRVVCYAWWLIPIYVTLNEKESGCSMIDEKYNIRFFDSIEETEQTMKELYETRGTKPKIKRVK